MRRSEVASGDDGVETQEAYPTAWGRRTLGGSWVRWLSVHLTGDLSPVTGDFYRYRYLAATLTGSGNRCFPIQNLKIQKSKKQLPLQ